MGKKILSLDSAAFTNQLRLCLAACWFSPAVSRSIRELGAQETSCRVSLPQRQESDPAFGAQELVNQPVSLIAWAIILKQWG